MQTATQTDHLMFFHVTYKRLDSPDHHSTLVLLHAPLGTSTPDLAQKIGNYFGFEHRLMSFRYVDHREVIAALAQQTSGVVSIFGVTIPADAEFD